MPSSDRPSRILPAGEVAEVPTAAGPARVLTVVPTAGAPRGDVLALGHGAGGGIDAADLIAVATAAAGAGWQVLLVEQPWRVAGRKVASPPAHLDRCWLEVLDAVLPGGLRGAVPGEVPGELPGGPSGGHRRRLVVGGRSAGARVACRTAAQLGADGVVALAFPLHPPGRPERSRVAELDGCGVPALVVQGERDPFGAPDEVRAALAQASGRPDAGPGDAVGPFEVVKVAGTHALSADVQAVAAAVTAWLGRR